MPGYPSRLLPFHCYQLPNTSQKTISPAHRRIWSATTQLLLHRKFLALFLHVHLCWSIYRPDVDPVDLKTGESYSSVCMRRESTAWRTQAATASLDVWSGLQQSFLTLLSLSGARKRRQTCACSADDHGRQTDRQTKDHVCNNRPHLRSTAMRPNNTSWLINHSKTCLR